VLTSGHFVGISVGSNPHRQRDTNMPLADVKCRNSKGQIRPYKLSDGGGLYLLVNPDGARYWRLAYRLHGKQRTLALGIYPAVGLMEARAGRDDAKRSLATNFDLSAIKRERKRAAKIASGNEALALEWCENWLGARTPYYVGSILRRLKAEVFRSIGPRPIYPSRRTSRDRFQLLRAVAMPPAADDCITRSSGRRAIG
jgi:hypothetical protein